jgi:hypothetical protein
VPILNELLGDGGALGGGGSSYNFRCDDSMTLWRECGFTAAEGTPGPHGGGGQRARAMGYNVVGGKIHSGATRVVWELTGVPAATCGGTLLLPGSHKAAFDFPPAVKARGNLHMRSYTCPPGSLLIFSESLLHASADWTWPDHPRVAIFSHYNSLFSQLHRLALPHAAIMTMPERRRSLFRGVWQGDFAGLDGDRGPGDDRGNSRYTETNSAAHSATSKL